MTGKRPARNDEGKTTMIIEQKDRKFANAKATHKVTKIVRWFTVSAIGTSRLMTDLRNQLGAEYIVTKW